MVIRLIFVLTICILHKLGPGRVNRDLYGSVNSKRARTPLVSGI